MTAKKPMKIRDRIVELRRVNRGDVLPNDKNYRRHPDNQRQAMAGILREIGIAGAALAYYSRRNKGELTFIDGHLRDEEIPENLPVLITDLKDAEADLLLATYDRMSAMATTDKEALDALLHDVSTGDAGLQAMLAELANDNGLYFGEPPTQAQEDESQVAEIIDRAAELQKKWQVSRGQVWQIGKHRLMCGDSTSADDVARLLGNGKPNLMVTDPPYGVEYDANWRNEAFTEGNRSTGKVINDDNDDWNAAWQLFLGNVAYVWHADLRASVVQASLESVGFEMRCQIIWSKNHFVIGRGHYSTRHEPCWYAVRSGENASWIGKDNEQTVWEFGLDARTEGGHSAQKPIECMARPIRNHEGEVYDPFVGSGTTLVACENLSRKCYAMEISEAYVSVCLERLTLAFPGIRITCKSDVSKQAYR